MKQKIVTFQKFVSIPCEVAYAIRSALFVDDVRDYESTKKKERALILIPEIPIFEQWLF